MVLFTSQREKKLWLWTLAVVGAIYGTLGLVQPLAGLLRDRGILSAAFWLCITLVALTILVHGLKRRPSRAEIWVWLGIASVYLLLFLRMTVPEERSHLIEYSVVGVFIYEALKERARHSQVRFPALIAIVLTILIGTLDECIQLLLPIRVFNLFDILFNALAGLLAISSSAVLAWIRSRVGK